MQTDRPAGMQICVYACVHISIYCYTYLHLHGYIFRRIHAYLLSLFDGLFIHFTRRPLVHLRIHSCVYIASCVCMYIYISLSLSLCLSLSLSRSLALRPLRMYTHTVHCRHVRRRKSPFEVSEPISLNPKPSTPNAKPQTLNPKPQTQALWAGARLAHAEKEQLQ